MTATTNTQAAKVIAAFENGDELSGKQISARFGVKNVRALISSLRMQGYSVYNNQRTNGSGETSSKYRLGTPSRAVVAAGYQALAM